MKVFHLIAVVSTNNAVNATATIALSVAVVMVLYWLASIVTKKQKSKHLSLLVTTTRKSAVALTIAISGSASIKFAPLSWQSSLDSIARIAAILAIVWIIVNVLAVLSSIIIERFDVNVPDNRDARRAVTQISLIHRVISITIIIIGVLVSLTTLPVVRTFGTTVLASAGVLGIVAGIAGQSTLGNMIAGIQIAFSGALKIGDVVVVQNQWGTIETITLTYVVVKIWDERRLVMPVSYFVNTPFENWTRDTSQILGTVLIFVDYSISIDDLRNELKSYVENHPLWDKRVVTLQVVNSTELAIQIRALVSASTSSNSWNLRCDVREHLISYLRNTSPGSLPKVHIDLSSTDYDLNQSEG
ncbi:MAG: mechanosensitive ion channel [Actinomycetota bacterium]|nr:mechanosensitive ion channel [Actinomycetota bacterium]